MDMWKIEKGEKKRGGGGGRLVWWLCVWCQGRWDKFSMFFFEGGRKKAAMFF